MFDEGQRVLDLWHVLQCFVLKLLLVNRENILFCLSWQLMQMRWESNVCISWIEEVVSMVVEECFCVFRYSKWKLTKKQRSEVVLLFCCRHVRIRVCVNRKCCVFYWILEIEVVVFTIEDAIMFVKEVLTKDELVMKWLEYMKLMGYDRSIKRDGQGKGNKA